MYERNRQKDSNGDNHELVYFVLQPKVRQHPSHSHENHPEADCSLVNAAFNALVLSFRLVELFG
jgi:hypothetical protein